MRLVTADAELDGAACRGFLAARLGAALFALREAGLAFLAALRAVAVLPRVVFLRTADFAALRVAVARLAVFFVAFFFAALSAFCAASALALWFARRERFFAVCMQVGEQNFLLNRVAMNTGAFVQVGFAQRRRLVPVRLSM